MLFDADPPPGYELEEPLGDGGMGVVYRARQHSSGGRLVALKRVRVRGDGHLRARIQREAEILASLDHPHIIRVYEFVPDHGGIAIAMQYAPGGSLADRLTAETRLDASSVVAFAAPIAQALASAHRRGVLHRDIKPGNILFTSDDEPLLSDFGIARWSQAEQLTQAGVRLGTAEYLDPEVANGCAPDERSDIYSLGLVCYEALTGRPPYTGPTPLSVMRATDRGEYTPLAQAAPDCPQAVAEVVERAMSRTRKDRYASSGEFALALRRADWSAQTGRGSHGAVERGTQLVPGVPPLPGSAARPLVRRSDAPRAAEPRLDAPRAAEPRSDASRAAEPRSDAPRAAERRFDAPQAAEPRLDAPPAAEPRSDAPRAAEPRSDASRAAEPRSDASRAAEPRSTRMFGPRPPTPVVPAAPPSRVPKAAVWAAAIVLLLTPLAAVLLLARGQPSSGAEDAVQAAPIVPPDSSPSCPPASRPVTEEGERVISGDLDGDGCESFVTWGGNRLMVYRTPERPEATYELGEAGDELVLGDWDCDGVDTPALYRPLTGEVFLVNQWAATSREMTVYIAPRQARGGAVTVVRGGDGCGDTVKVALSTTPSQ
ncbi:MAG: protein kinase domain-containing protein [Egibacteraceae bacterium]